MSIVSDKELIEKLAELEHNQWWEWTKLVMLDFLVIIEQSKDNKEVYKIAKDRVLKWQKNYLPYFDLPEEVKEHDRIWARKVLEIIKKKWLPADIENILKITRALEDFKLKCYERMNKGDKDYDEFIMNNAPCNYNLILIERKLKSR